MRIVAINGSPRKNWNTGTLLQEALAGADSQGAQTELVDLYKLKYTGCISCFACKRKGGEYGKCVVQDDLAPVLGSLKQADAVIFGSPIYFANITAGMTAFLERFLFSNYIYSMEIPTVFPKVLPTGFIYSMNITQQQMAEFGMEALLKPYQGFIGHILGKQPEVLYVYDTYQFTDYDKFESSMFSEAAKAKQKAEQFPLDCQSAFTMGAKLASVQNRQI